ncbi:MAG: hypothetical protein ACPGH0_04540 [Opitutales bacterium]
MSEQKEPNREAKLTDASPNPKPEGFFKRIFTKMDGAIKAKAEAQSGNACCSGDQGDGKGGTCC